ncbi:MAG: ABC transporter permease [Gemmatimonadota bacterium]
MGRRLLALWARKVPAATRDRWLDEWEAELFALEAREHGRSKAARWWITTRFTLGARAHAAELARMEPNDKHGMTTMMTLGKDLKFAARSFARAPGFTAVALLTLALGIGATTTMFSVLHGVVLKPLPYESPNELVMVGSTSQRIPGLAPVAPADFMDWRAEATTFSHLVATEAWTLDLTDADRPARISSAAVTGGFFDMLGVAPMLGRGITRQDEIEGAEPIVVISHGLWERRYGSDPDIVGRRVTTADQTFTLVGVMPASFEHPEAFWSEDVELWLPTSQTGSNMTTRGGRFLQVMGRLTPGTTLFVARQDMALIAAALVDQHPNTNRGRETLIEPLQSETLGDVDQALTMLMGAVGMLLLIACVNVANLFMARAADRGRELAVRTAMGASVGRIRAQLLTEGVTLSLVGGVLGIGIAYLGVTTFRSINPVGIPRVEAVTVDARVLSFAFFVSVATGVAFALAPAYRMVGDRSLQSLRDGARGGLNPASSRFRHTLVAVEIGLAVVLMVGAGLFANSFLRLQSVDPGFDPENAVTMAITLNSGYEEVEQQLTLFRDLVDGVGSMRDVTSVAYTSALPLAGDRYLTGVNLQDRESDPSNPDVAEYSTVSPGFFAAMQIDMATGREFNDLDDAGSDRVMVVNEAFARRYWPGEDPVGKAVALSRRNPEWYAVVGVATDVHRQALDEPATPEVFLSSLQRGVTNAQVVARTSGDIDETVASMRALVGRLDGTLPVDFNTMDEYVAESVNQSQFYTQLFGAFAAVALLLAGVGVYGTMSYTVGQRTREMGIRRALGAESSQVSAMVAKQGLLVTTLGLGVGLVAALVGARVLESFLFGISARDPLTYATGSMMLGVVAMIACWLPARRAGRADPMGALRTE